MLNSVLRAEMRSLSDMVVEPGDRAERVEVRSESELVVRLMRDQVLRAGVVCRGGAFRGAAGGVCLEDNSEVLGVLLLVVRYGKRVIVWGNIGGGGST